MDKAKETAITVVVTLLVASIINLGIGLLTMPSGSATIGQPITVGQKVFVPFDIGNYQNQTIDGLRLSIPSTTNVKDIITAPPVQIEPVKDVTSADATSRIIVSGIENHRITKLFVPIASSTDAHLCRINNSREKGLESREADDLPAPITPIVEKAVASAVIYSIIAGLVAVLIVRPATDRLNRSLTASNLLRDEQKHHMEQIDRKLNTAEAAHKQLLITYAKMLVLFQARLYDYSKELSFWRNTIRAVLRTGQTDPDELLQSVTKSLKTYLTSPESDQFSFEALKAASNLLRDEPPHTPPVQ